ncbi:hypothetical protein [Crossiella cryophila]|uniref:Uncharacterized protein n=1 Tax=Crossiella cryophila TaxID=43355 RepID=A0A7W7CF69_9PSEU|nr:hypothetical protein [Crossiella cryophila]MBB4680110.1 hypothetical protein [Crossiella cryophila]
MRKLIRRALALPACPLLATGAVLVTTLALVDPGSTPAMRPGDCVAVMRPAGLKSAGQAQDLEVGSYTCVDQRGAVANPVARCPSCEVVAKMWADRDYAGASVEIKIDAGSDCDRDGYRWDHLPAGWNDRVSSYRTYKSCRHSGVYENINTSGYCETQHDDVAYVGDLMNDLMSSFRLQSENRNCRADLT